MSTSIYEEYIQLTKTYQSKYGEKTVVLLQVGAFFEVYGFRCPRTGEIGGSQITEFTQLCNLNVSEKKAVYQDCAVFMAGFRDYTLDKYLQKITDQGYTAVVYVQVKEGKMIKRVLDAVHSAGTYMSYDTDSLPQITNNIMCIWIDQYSTKTNTKTTKTKSNSNPTTRPDTNAKETMVCGIAVANIFTGVSNLHEFQRTLVHLSDRKIQHTTMDELERMVSIHHPSEVVIVSDLSDTTIQSIIQFSGFPSQTTFHYVSKMSSEKAQNCEKQKYIHNILDKFYGKSALHICQEFDRYPTATQAFCFLMDFVQEHNPNLVRNIMIPTFQDTTQVLLANHTLKQLNILDQSSDHIMPGQKRMGQVSSVSTLLNKCITAMGRRQFHMQLVSPTTDEAWLKGQYATTELVLSHYDALVDPIRRLLTPIRDMDKFSRQLIMQKLLPSSIWSFYQSTVSAREISGLISACVQERELIDTQASISAVSTKVQEFLDKHFHMDVCQSISNLNNFDQCFVKHGIVAELDDILDKYEENIRQFNAIHLWLNRLIRQQEGIPESASTQIEYVKIHETEKSGTSFQITKKRGTLLKKCLVSDTVYSIPETNLTVEGKDIKFSSASGSADEISFPILSKICNEMLYQKEERNRRIVLAYLEVLIQLEKTCFSDIEILSRFISNIDVVQCKAYIAKQYQYCCPRIGESYTESCENGGGEGSYVNAEGLRHALIEHIQQREFYVSNDIFLGQDQKGVLLYGTNAVGKTSFIRALGIAVIMAQSGLHVPCTQFVYKPYTAIFSRILGNDNLFKGLSTFAVEMSELRVILKMADNRSLILGDELCSGTETESALSIFVSGLMDLHAKHSSFIFATHFHEIIKYEEVQGLDRLSLMHMAVHYDRETDQLVYDRKLQPGPGNRMYGLEVCRSLHLPEDFLTRAYDIRTKYWPDVKGMLSYPTSRYNAAKIRGLCEMCGLNLGEETHHVHMQADADQDGMIRIDQNGNKTTIHKNHPANLMSVCSRCHDKHHQNLSK
jgi:DNA mismatch repair protein MutS